MTRESVETLRRFVECESVAKFQNQFIKIAVAAPSQWSGTPAFFALAFNIERRGDAQISVAHDVFGEDWKLVVADNGTGKPDGVFPQLKPGLGSGIVSALASQLDAQVVTVSGPQGTTVSVTHSMTSAEMAW